LPASVLVFGGFAVLVWLPVAVLLLTPVFSRDAGRCDRAEAMVDRLLAVLPRSPSISAPAVPLVVLPDRTADS
jgi:hypothetical protein